MQASGEDKTGAKNGRKLEGDEASEAESKRARLASIMAKLI
jgi:hypothetical protein